MTWHVGGEDAYYDAPYDQSHDCPYTAAGLLDCYCGGSVYPDDARDWLHANGIEINDDDLVEVIVAVEENHPGGWEGFYDECAAEKAARRLGRFDYADVIAKARAA